MVETKTGTPEFVAVAEKFFRYQTFWLRKFGELASHPRREWIRPLIYATCRTCDSIEILARYGFVNEIYMLSRALVERLITTAYIAICEEDELNRFSQYSKQKAYRMLDRTVKAGEAAFRLYFTGDISPESIPGMKEALSSFTSQRGREITRWTNKSLYDLVKYVSEHSRKGFSNLLLNLLAVYDQGSEALHGTLYGCTFDLGLFDIGPRPKNEEEFKEHMLGVVVMLFLSGGYALNELIGVLDEEGLILAESDKLSLQFCDDYLRAVGIDPDSIRPDASSRCQ